jgi:hypothetical protein
MKTVFQTILAIVIVILGYLIVQSIMKPIRFNKERDTREEATISKLKDIRTMEVAYKDKFNKYTGSFDTLTNFVKHDSFDIVKIIGTYDQDEMTQQEALRKGIIKKAITKVPVLDSLFRPGYPVDSVRYIPYTDHAQFDLGAGEVKTGSGVVVKVFQASALYDTLFAGMDKQLIINYKEEQMKITKFPGLRVGSLTEPTNNAGNWEK